MEHANRRIGCNASQQDVEAPDAGCGKGEESYGIPTRIIAMHAHHRRFAFSSQATNGTRATHTATKPSAIPPAVR